jgi:Lrp/AsnC family leucine-responsive transcriptional regulator
MTILKALAKDARKTNVETAKLSELSEDAVRQRIKRLESQNIIMGYTIALNTAIMGLESYAISMQIEDSAMRKLDYFVANEPSIVFCAKISGKNNIMLTVTVGSRTEFKAFIDKMNATLLDAVKSYDIQMVMQDIKEEFLSEELFRAENT